MKHPQSAMMIDDLWCDAAPVADGHPPTDPADLRHCGITTFADLFCGIGGFHYAAHALGLQCTFACDINAAARRQYADNFGMMPEGDITRIDSDHIPDHDLLLGGFPCQSFSIIGKRGGLDDKRGALVYEIVRILRDRRPAGFVLENVKQLATINGGRNMAAIERALRELGYDLAYRVLNALHFGLPQKRERIFIVGLRCGLDNFEWPRPTEGYRPLAEILEPDPAPEHSASERIRRSRMAAHTSRHSPGIWHENKGGNISSHPYSCALRAGASYNYLLVDGKRRLTPRELLRLQGFPERMRIIGSTADMRTQAGNAVPVPMAQAVIRSVLHAHQKSEAQGQLARRDARAVPA